MRWFIFSLLTVFFLSGCLLLPTERTRYYGKKYGFERQELKGTDFTHVVYFSHPNPQSETLHVYLEGDGRPWATRFQIAEDPTGWRPLMLQLMVLDHQPGLYLGRPCYDGFVKEKTCQPALWTSARHSKTVVDSMAAVLSRFIARHPVQHLEFFGHSGGGALAMLLAAKFPQTETVVTVAGNLDIDAWTKYHHYSRLLLSLNPAKQPALSPSIQQLHLLAGRDKVIPPKLVKPWIARQPQAQSCVISTFTHLCCWKKIWPSVVKFGTKAFPGCSQLNAEAGVL